MVMVIERMKVEDGVKIKDAEIIDTVNYRYIVDDYEDLINIYMYGLKGKDLHVTSMDNQISLKKYCQ